MKKFFNVLFVATLVVGTVVLVSCGKDDEGGGTKSDPPTMSLTHPDGTEVMSGGTFNAGGNVTGFTADVEGTALVSFEAVVSDATGDLETYTAVLTGAAGAVLVDLGDSQNIASGMDYTVTVTITDEDLNETTFTFTLAVHMSNEDDMYLRGSVNSDAWDNPQQAFLYDDNTWKVSCGRTLTGSTEYKYKMANTNDWSDADWGDATGATGTLSVTSGGGTDASFTPDADGVYVWTFNDSDLSFSIAAQ